MANGDGMVIKPSKGFLKSKAFLEAKAAYELKQKAIAAKGDEKGPEKQLEIKPDKTGTTGAYPPAPAVPQDTKMESEYIGRRVGDMKTGAQVETCEKGKCEPGTIKQIEAERSGKKGGTY